MVATAYLLGVSTRRVERLAGRLGVTSLSRSQVSEMATHFDAQVAGFRERPLDAGRYTFVWVDALTVKVREDGRVVNVHALVATGVNADGHREILGLDVASAEDGSGRLAFLRGLVARGLSGGAAGHLRCPPGLVAAIGSALPGAAWQRCRTHWSRTRSTRRLFQCSVRWFLARRRVGLLRRRSADRSPALAGSGVVPVADGPRSERCRWCVG